jgi:hypothetical protein
VLNLERVGGFRVYVLGFRFLTHCDVELGEIRRVVV